MEKRRMMQRIRRYPAGGKDHDMNNLKKLITLLVLIIGMLAVTGIGGVCGRACGSR